MRENERLDEFFTYTRMISRMVTRLRLDAVKEENLKTIHVECLFYLIYKGPLSSAQLVRYTLEDKAAISKALKTLKEKGFVSYKTGYNEKISLLEKGKMLAEQIEEKSFQILKEARDGISDEEAKVFLSVLERICLNLADKFKIGSEKHNIKKN